MSMKEQTVNGQQVNCLYLL